VKDGTPVLIRYRLREKNRRTRSVRPGRCRLLLRLRFCCDQARASDPETHRGVQVPQNEMPGGYRGSASFVSTPTNSSAVCSSASKPQHPSVAPHRTSPSQRTRRVCHAPQGTSTGRLGEDCARGSRTDCFTVTRHLSSAQSASERAGLFSAAPIGADRVVSM
jgi:hypothetical protein